MLLTQVRTVTVSYTHLVLSYALVPAVAKDFFEYRAAQQTKVDGSVADKDSKAYPCLLYTSDAEKAVQVIHDKFFSMG